jgi:transcriptional regulator with XRE-family HTH domain
VSQQLTFGQRVRAARIAKGWSQAQLARRLAVAEGRGHAGLDRGSVYRWERGTRVPDYWKPWLIQVLELDEEPEQALQQQPGLGVDYDQSSDTVASVIQLGGRDLQRRQFLAATSAYALAALALPDLDAITRRTRAAAAGGPVNVGRGEVLAIRQMTTVLGDAASELGGGHARHLAVRYLTQDVAPWLTGNYCETTGRELFAATSQLVHLAGWMAGDEGNQGLAQRYYAHSFRLAAEAGDPELSATALRGMAVQAIDLGHRAAAVRLSEECVRYAGGIKDPRAVAYYQATLANAASLDGDRRTASAALAASASAIENAPATPGESWAAHYSPGRWAHETGMILAQLGDLDAAEDHLHHALAIHGLDRRRTRAIVLADLGQVHLRRDDTDAALATWNDFLDTAEGIRSVKVTTAVDEMRARLHRLRDVSAAAELDQRAASLA